MKILINLFILLTVVFQSVMVCGQSAEAKMVFEKKNHNFGKIKEAGGNVEYKYVFMNTGAETIEIEDVKVSCGCTVPEWTRKQIKPGEKGFVNVVFNPKNRPGRFNKSVTVISNAENSPIQLRISGEVLDKKITLKEEYRSDFDSVRLKRTNVNFSELYKKSDKNLSKKVTEFKKDKSNVREIEIINTKSVSARLTFNDRRKIPKHLKIEVVPETLKPNEKGKIIVTYNVDEKDDWGYVYDRLTVSVNGVPNSRNRLTVSATINELFTEEQKKNPPTMDFLDGTEFKFGNITQGDKVEHVFHFKNNGKNDLIIRKTKASCGCTAIAPNDKVIKPGQESSIKTIFNSRGKKGRQSKTITITTNIPGKTGNTNNSRVILKVSGNVDVPKKENKQKIDKKK